MAEHSGAYDGRMSSHHRKPSRGLIGRLAEQRPHLLNPLVAFFVMGWTRVHATSTPLHGQDQTGTTRLVPDYVELLGVDECVSLLLAAPEERIDGNDSLSSWLSKL